MLYKKILKLDYVRLSLAVVQLVNHLDEFKQLSLLMFFQNGQSVLIMTCNGIIVSDDCLPVKSYMSV